jgi:hypothetical protein
LTGRGAGDTIRGVRVPFLLFGATIIAVAACGARSSLDVEQFPHHEPEAGPDAEDAGPDAEDAADVDDAPPDAPPDVVVPPPDCADAGTTFIYLITEQNELIHYYPPDNDFGSVGFIQCAGPGNPFSMAVDRKGTAYVLFDQGNVFEVSTADATCKSTTYVPGQHDFTLFGMGFSADVADPGETLFVARDCGVAGASCTSGADCCSEICAGGMCVNTGVSPGTGSLGTLDTTTLHLTDVGHFNTDIGEAELTGTGAGDLYGFGVEDSTSPVTLHLAQIRKTDAHVIDDNFITMDTQPTTIDAWAFASWGGSFYFFTATGADGNTSTISKYTPGTPGTPLAKKVASFDGTIVGAGVSTCAPQIAP